MDSVTIRNFDKKDLPEIRQFDGAWAIRISSLTAKQLCTFPVLVAEFESRVVGFAAYERHEAPWSFATESNEAFAKAEVLREVQVWEDGIALRQLFVVPDLRRRGFGRQLIERLQSENAPILAAVPERDVEAQRFLKACGFRAETGFPQNEYVFVFAPPEFSFRRAK
jgi:GNAT superfamily N-acetyltransferase